MENTLLVSSSPHINAKISTASIMRDVSIALIPALLCGIYFFGIKALILTLISAASCVIIEALWQKICKKPITVSDGTAVVTGILLAFNMPVTVPWWLPVIGSVVAIIIAKQLFGGTGHNFINPALAGRAFLLASWPVLMTSWVAPLSGADAVSSATPLAILKGTQAGELTTLFNAFIGNIGGCIGETSALCLLIGGIYLFARKIIFPVIPFTFIGTVAVLFFIFPSNGLSNADSMLYNILCGGLFLGAFFMATDYTTSPITLRGQAMAGIFCGLLTFVIRRFGGYPEGVSYAILLMNIATPLIDKITRPKKFGFAGGAKKQ